MDRVALDEQIRTVYPALLTLSGGAQLRGAQALLDVFDPTDGEPGNTLSFTVRTIGGSPMTIGVTARAAPAAVPLEKVMAFVNPFTEGGRDGAQASVTLESDECYSASGGTFSSVVSDDGQVDAVGQFKCLREDGSTLDTYSFSFRGPLVLHCHAKDPSDPSGWTWYIDDGMTSDFCSSLDFH